MKAVCGCHGGDGDCGEGKLLHGEAILFTHLLVGIAVEKEDDGTLFVCWGLCKEHVD